MNNHVNLTTIGLLHEAFLRLDDPNSSGAAWLQALGGSAPIFALLSAAQHAIVKKPNGGMGLISDELPVCWLNLTGRIIDEFLLQLIFCWVAILSQLCALIWIHSTD